MISKSQLKELCQYKQQKQCDADHVFVVEGTKMCCEALASEQPVVAVAALPKWLREHGCQCTGIPTLRQERVYELAPSDLERLSGQKSPNQVWMLLKRPSDSETSPEAMDVTGEELLLLLDHLQDPGNMGTIIRTADWFGIRHIYCSGDTVSCYNPKVVQATMGGLFRTKVNYGPLVPLMQRLRAEGHEIFGAMLDGVNVYHLGAHTRKEPCREENGTPCLQPGKCKVLVIGNESRGIRGDVAAMVTKRVKIPNLGGTCESLNASIAAAVLISELLREKSALRQ